MQSEAEGVWFSQEAVSWLKRHKEFHCKPLGARLPSLASGTFKIEPITKRQTYQLVVY